MGLRPWERWKPMMMRIPALGILIIKVDNRNTCRAFMSKGRLHSGVSDFLTLCPRRKPGEAPVSC